MTTNTIQVRKKGTFTLPMDLRTKYGVDEGDVFTLIDMGDGSFLLTPRISQVNRLGDRVAEIPLASPLAGEYRSDGKSESRSKGAGSRRS